MNTMRTLTHDEWKAEATKRFGTKVLAWRFVCPCCKHVASVADWQKVGAKEGAIAFSCVGRWTEKPRKAFEEGGPGPCNYTGGGLFNLNPVKVTGGPGGDHHVFEFAD